MQLRYCLGTSSSSEAQADDENTDSSTNGTCENRERDSSCPCSACAAAVAIQRWQAWKPLELPPLLSASALRSAFASVEAVASAAVDSSCRRLTDAVGTAGAWAAISVSFAELRVYRCREASCSKLERTESTPHQTPEASPPRLAVETAGILPAVTPVTANQHSSNNRKAVGARLVAAAAAAVTAAASPLQAQRLGRQKLLSSGSSATSPLKGVQDSSSRQPHQQPEAIALSATDARVRRRSRSSDEKGTADSANKKRHTPTDDGIKIKEPKLKLKILKAVLSLCLF